MIKILNLTRYNATHAQMDDGVVEPDALTREAIKDLLTFNRLPTREDLTNRARALARIAYDSGYGTAMICGPPYFMNSLERALQKVGVFPVYSYSEVVTIERQNPNGEVVRTEVWRHKGWVNG